MKTEVQCGCEFISKLLSQRHLPVQFSKPFKRRMEELLLERYRDHWDPTNPSRGSAYRCIRINGCRLDPVVKEAAKVTGLTNISEYLPSQLTLWIDPCDVSYRFGEDGSICSCSMESASASSGVSRSNTYSAASPSWSPNGIATNTNTAQVSPVGSRTASPSPVKRSTSTPAKHHHHHHHHHNNSHHRPLTPPSSLLRTVSPTSHPSTAGGASSASAYYMNQVYDSLSRMDYVIPVQV